MKKNFPFHIVTFRLITLNTLIRTAIWIYRSTSILIILNLINSILISRLWFRERTFQGIHTLFITNFYLEIEQWYLY